MLFEVDLKDMLVSRRQQLPSRRKPSRTWQATWHNFSRYRL